MKSNLKQAHRFWVAPIGAIGAIAMVVGSIAWINAEPVGPACDRHGFGQSGPAPACQAGSVEPRPAPVVKQHISHDDDRLYTASAKVGAPRYSELDIQKLNGLMQIPDSGAMLLEEIERLSLQQRRFERRYGPESVAARSVRFRLRDLHDHVSDGLQYAAQDKRGGRDDR